MYAMSFFGGGEMMGGIFIGQIVDRISSKVGVLVNLVLLFLMIAMTLFYIIHN
jgi:hypothetical protein